MLENLLFSLNRVLPFFLLIVLGIFLRSRKVLPEVFFEYASTFTFKVSLPLSLFLSIAVPQEGGEISPRLLWYAGATTVLVFLAVWLVTECIYRDKTIVGTLVQGGFRGNFVLLGIPLMEAVAGRAAAQKAAFAIMVVIPLYNILSVIVLTARSAKPGKPSLRDMARGIVTNPLIIAIVLGLPFFFFHIPIPYFAYKTIDYMGQTATPLGLLAIGGLFRMEDAMARLRPALYASAVKIVLQPGVMMAVSYACGFRGEDLLVLFILYASPVAVSSPQMARAMYGDGPLASNILILTTLFSAIVFAAGIYAMRTFGVI